MNPLKYIPFPSSQCQNASTILQSHGMIKEAGVSVSDFAYLCPALLVQIDSNSCLVHDNGQLGEVLICLQLCL